MDEKWIGTFVRHARCIVNDIPVVREVTEGKALIVSFDDKPATFEELSLCANLATRASLISV
jgi:hypothetical protein